MRHVVEKLVRIRLGPVSLGRLQPKEFRQLTGDEVTKLRHAVGLRTPHVGPTRRRDASPRKRAAAEPTKSPSSKT